MRTEFLFAKGCKFDQQLLLLFSVVLLIINLFFLFFQYSDSTLILVALHLIVLIGLIFIIAKLHQIRISDNKILINNMWQKRQYPVEELVDIRLVHFVIPYPLNPYIKFVFKDGREYITAIPHPIKHYLFGGINGYINYLKTQVMK